MVQIVMSLFAPTRRTENTVSQLFSIHVTIKKTPSFVSIKYCLQLKDINSVEYSCSCYGNSLNSIYLII